MIRYFYGEDTFAAREAIGEVVAREKAQVQFLDAEVVTAETLPQVLERGAAGLFGKEIVVVREPSALSPALQEMLVAAALRGAGELVLWDSEKPGARSPLYKHFQKIGRHFAALPSQQLESWLIAEAKKRGVGLSPAAAQMLVARLGTDRWRLLSEIERLSLRREEITRQHVEDEVEVGKEEGEVFEMLRAVVVRNRPEAMRRLQGLLQSGASEFYILSMLAYQLRTLYLLAAGKSQGVSPRVAQSFTQVAKRRASAAWLADVTRVVAADFAIKQGKTDPRTGVVMLVMNLVF